MTQFGTFNPSLVALQFFLVPLTVTSHLSGAKVLNGCKSANIVQRTFLSTLFGKLTS